MAVLILFFSFIAAAAYSAELFVYEAGSTRPRKQLLQDNFAVCPSTYSPNGISIECVTLRKPYAEFSVNGVLVRTERQTPYIINGNTGAVAPRWTPPAGVVTLTCNGMTVMGTFGCAPAPDTDIQDSAAPAAAPTTTTTTSVNPASTSPKLFVRQAGEINPLSQQLKNGFQVCPTTFSMTGISIECVDPTASVARFTLNGVIVRTETWPPYSISGDTDAMLNPWNPPTGKVFLECITNLGNSSVSGTFDC